LKLIYRRLSLSPGQAPTKPPHHVFLISPLTGWGKR
jgi:hypothetical protein